MEEREWLSHTEDWRRGVQDYIMANDMEMTEEEKEAMSEEWWNGLKYAAQYPEKFCICLVPM